MTPSFLRRHPLTSAVLVGGAVAGAASLADPRIDPAEWHPPDPPAMTGPLERNRELADVETVVTCEGPEDVAFDDEGRMYTGTEDHSVVRTVDPVDADTTDAGLQSVAPDGRVTTLSAGADGREIAFADDLHVADDGTVYFTDATVHDVF